MEFSDIIIYSIRFFIPSVFSMLFRVMGLGYRSKGRVVLGFSVFTLYSMVVPSLLIALMGYGQYTHIASIVMLVGGLSVLIFTTDTPGKTIFLHLLQCNVVVALSVPLNMLRHLMGFSYATLLLLFLVVCPLMCALALRLWAKPLRFIADHLHVAFLPMLAMPIITLGIVMVLPTYPARNFEFHPVYCTVMMLAVELVLFLYIFNTYRNLREISILAKQELQQELLQQELSSYDDFLATARQNRHDLRHHNALLLTYLEAGDTARAVDYLHGQDKALSASSMVHYCENLTANAVLRFYERHAHALGVAYSAQAEVPAVLPLTDTEVGVLFSNLLENACEAAVDAAGGEIQFLSKLERNKLLVSVRNSVNGKRSFDSLGMPVSTKPGGGTGSHSVAAVVKRHGGMLRFSQEGDTFVTQITLPL